MNSQVLTASVLVLITVALQVDAACYVKYMFPPDNEPCEPGKVWDDMDSCVTCSCGEYGFTKSCCDISGYPVVNNKRKCVAVRDDNCKWEVKGKRPKWNKKCAEDVTTMIG